MTDPCTIVAAPSCRNASTSGVRLVALARAWTGCNGQTGQHSIHPRSTVSLFRRGGYGDAILMALVRLGAGGEQERRNMTSCEDYDIARLDDDDDEDYLKHPKGKGV